MNKNTYKEILKLVITEKGIVDSEIDHTYDVGYRLHARSERLFLEELLELLDKEQNENTEK